MRQNLKMLLLVIVYVSFFSAINPAQNVSGQDARKITVNKMSDKLQNKLLLSEKQKNSVKNILNEYFSEAAKLSGSQNAHQNQMQLKNNANEKIIKLLDRKQKMKFEIVKDDWWALANK
ncbi:hypothetical protein BMS3Abin03_02733 [bacterium BMS3Abin03]|nr:hypothetical protein BMS3Abin03_02733 [bacterium BMS3Abin03]